MENYIFHLDFTSAVYVKTPSDNYPKYTYKKYPNKVTLNLV